MMDSASAVMEGVHIEGVVAVGWMCAVMVQSVYVLLEGEGLSSGHGSQCGDADDMALELLCCVLVCDRKLSSGPNVLV